MKNISNIDLSEKTVLVRCDYNVSVKKGKVIDDFRITESIPTIRYLIDSGAKIILMSHMGRPENQKSLKNKGKERDVQFSLRPVYHELEKHFEDVSFVEDCVGKQVKNKAEEMREGEILLLENLRHYRDEEECTPDFSSALAELGDVYVNNAFSASHRKHASIWGVPKILPAYPGLLFEREVGVLSNLKTEAERPFVVLVGGAKISSKVKTIEYFIDKADKILLGGKTANTALALKGVMNMKIPKDTKEKVKNINLDSKKIELPVDVVSAENPQDRSEVVPVSALPEGWKAFDIGLKTVDKYSTILKKAGTIVWGGPLGYFENERFEEGTRQIGKEVAKNDKALTVIGGGDTAYAMKKFDLRNSIDHVSLGGGAMLNFLSDGSMPGLDILKK